ncbi:TetR/AcrR family transcriptional regulator [Actinocorallia sp. API 0066]|uniref:TetR/AcrR family transcriptional regulator n=1 Tax=Actinocorallia sp. API 0066 TaxID=2896846 RepID=UPI001E51D457|nr:TetR/AcrR family transcriptional regulator [Actinocorallia sp. API 0066]MCD0448900.1 TetR/AcrR family transcriptional regulator [Actinocorallia sp. API 0066]
MARADAVRNRRAILDATERLLLGADPASVSLDRVAAEAGVGKGTVFRRFGSRTGLFTELLAERAAALAEAIDHGPPPLGPGAPPADRVLAFLDALVDLAVGNLSLLSAHERACAADKYTDPTYLRWHTHLTTLIHKAAPTLDAPFHAHALLACFDAPLVHLLLTQGGPPRLRANLQALTTPLLTA